MSESLIQSVSQSVIVWIDESVRQSVSNMWIAGPVSVFEC